MFENFKTWLIENSNWLGPLAAVLAILSAGIVISTWKRILGIFTWLKNKLFKKSVPDTKIILVLNPRRTFWNMASRDNKPCMQINTSWYVTNASEIPLKILGAKLLIPNPKNKLCTATVMIISKQFTAHSGIDVPIPPHQTVNMEASFFFEPPTQKENEPLIVKLFITDQYGQKHESPKIKLRYQFPSAETF